MARAYVNNKGAEDDKRQPPKLPGGMGTPMPKPGGGGPAPKGSHRMPDGTLMKDSEMPSGGGYQTPPMGASRSEMRDNMRDRGRPRPTPAQIQPPTMPMPFNPGEVERARDETLRKALGDSGDQGFQPFSPPTPMQMPNIIPQSEAMQMPMPQNRGMGSAPMPQANPNQMQDFIAQMLGGAAGAMPGQGQPMMGDPGLEAYMRALQQRM